MAPSVLVSQIGYRPEDPKIVVVRGDGGDDAPSSAALIRSGDGAVVAEAPVVPAGRWWGAVYWTADLADADEPGRYAVRLPGGEVSNEFEIADDVLLHRTLLPTSVETLEARIGGKLGWQDCAFDGRGLESHAIVVLGLADVLALVPALDGATRDRLREQLRHGAEYLAACQRDDGSFMNEYYLARDRTTWTLCGLGCLALARAAEALSSGPLLDRAKAAWRWCTTHGSTVAAEDLDPTRRLFGQYPPWTPPDAPRARDLLLLLRAATELYRNTNDLTYAGAATRLARTLHDDYQRAAGDFWAWPDTGIHQRAWEHLGWGYHCGAVLPDDVSGFVALLELFPGHADTSLWREVLHRYAYGYLLPACELTPFGIYPLGDCEGEVRFFGPSWHGFNGMYAQVARTCMLLARTFRDPRLERAAQRNLQWIAGANVEGLSWISGIGARSTEVWSGIPGSIGNGFCANAQFRLGHLDDLADAPAYRTDEDWLVHNGFWLSGLAEVSTRPRVKVRVQDAGRPVSARVTLHLGDATFEAVTNVRGVVVFDELPRLRSGAVEVVASDQRLRLPVQPVSGASLDLVADLTETLLAEWEDEGDRPRLRVTNLGSAPATVRIEYSGGEAADGCELPAGESVVLEPPEEAAAWLRAVVTGRFSVAEAEHQ